MRKLLQKFVLYVSLTCSTLTPMVASADAVDSAFSNLLGSTTVSKDTPGMYSSQARNTFVAGGLDVRFPRTQATNLVSLTPPSLSAGCGGISAHFGGFSFISGKQIETLIKNIAAGAPGFVVNLAIKTLCPQCEAVLQVMQKLAQDAAKMSMDSCRISEGLVNKLGSEMGFSPVSDSNKARISCGQESASSGDSNDLLEAMDSACSSVRGSLQKLQGWLDETFPKKGSGSAQNPNQEGASRSADISKGNSNITWDLLKLSGFGSQNEEDIRMRLVLMNIMGTKVRDSSKPEGENFVVYPPTMGNVRGASKEGGGSPQGSDMDTAVAYFMCGTDTSKWDKLGRSAAKYCLDFSGAKNPSSLAVTGQLLEVWDCDGAGNDAYDKCLNLTKRKMNTINALKTSGFLPMVSALLRDGVDRVRNNKDFKDADGQRILKLIEISPFPLYQAINITAVYPSAAADLIDTMAVLTAELLVYGYMDQMVRTAEQLQAQVESSFMDQMYSFLGAMRVTMQERRKMIGQNIALQQGIIEQIRSLNIAMQRQVMTGELLGQQRYATTVNNNNNGSTP